MSLSVMDPLYLTLGAMILFLVISLGNTRYGVPLLSIVNRWLRWIAFSSAIALVIQVTEVLDRPYWVLFLASFLSWFLLETIYNWILINALSHSQMPLFPRFQENSDGDEWPISRQSIIIRDWLRAQKFRKLQSLKASLVESVHMRSSIYQNEDNTVRCQIMFLPRSSGMNVFYVLTSKTEQEERIVTDNSFMPSGAYHPENWFIERCPLTFSLARLLKRHQRRLKDYQVAIVPFGESEPIEDVNKQQRELERLNVQEGFLQPYEHQEDYGRITWEGRYRLWKELWLLNYLGMTIDKSCR